MNTTSKNGEKSSYLVLLLLVLGLTAFSSAMRDLNEVRQFLLDTSQLVAQSSEQVVPNEIPQTIVKLETCDSNKGSEQSAPAVELPWLDSEVVSKVVERRVPPAPRRPVQLANRDHFVDVPGVKSLAAQIAKLEKMRRLDFEGKQFEFVITTDHDDSADAANVPEPPVTYFKVKPRKNGGNKITPRDREMLLKTLNRSINLRSAS